MGGTMADFETGDVVRLGAAFLYSAADTIVNVWHVKITSGGPLAFVTASLDFQEYVDDLYRPLVGYYRTVLVGDRISVKNETQNTVWGAIGFNPSFTGTHVGQGTALQVALLGWGRTAISRVQIRKYWGPFGEAEMEHGLWTTAIRADIQDQMDYHIGEHVMSNGLELQGVAYNKALDRATTCLTATTTGNPVIQRRRRFGRGA